mgnify:CR=1 FL=1
MYLNPNTHTQGDLVLSTNPTTQVVSVTDIKAHLRIDTSDEDSLLGVYIDAATEMAEHFCGRHFITHDYKLYFNQVQSVASLIYPDCTLLSVVASGEVTAVYPVNWVDSSPTLKDNLANVFWYEFKTGFGDASTDVPEAIKQAIKLIVSDMYYFREDRKRKFPMASEILLQPYKCYH